MDISLSSTLTTSKLFLCHPSHKNLPGRNKFNVVSCKATTQSGGRGAVNLFEVFSLDPNAGIDEIKKAYRNMALRYHPDVCDSSKKKESTQMFVELHKAYKTLLDHTSQSEYSRELNKRERRSREGISRDKWESQLFELNRRSHGRKEQMEGSWGCRMRAQFRNT